MTTTTAPVLRTDPLPWGVIGVVSLTATALMAVLVGLVVGGGAEAPLISDPGAVVRYGLPIAKLLGTLGAAGAIGGLLLALLALAPERPEFGRALDVAAASAAVLVSTRGWRPEDGQFELEPPS